MASPLVFTQADSGAPALNGNGGTLINVLSASLIVNKLFTAVSGGSFVDNTTEARLEGGTTFKLFQTPGTNDEAYIGMSVPFDRMTIDLATLGIGGSYAVKYWNGSSWVTLTVSDGTKGFTQDGMISWTIPTDWATKAVNSVTLYWIQIVPLTVPSTNPLLNYLTVTGWTEAFTGTNKRVYRQGGGNLFYLRVQDDGNTWGTGTPSSATTKEALIRLAESASAIDTLTNPVPTVAQLAEGIVVRKSNTADGTARNWVLIADDRTILYLGILSGDTANEYRSTHLGDFFSFKDDDSYRAHIVGRTGTNSTSNASEQIGQQCVPSSTVAGHYAARTYTGSGTSVAAGAHGDVTKGDGAASGIATAQWISVGRVPYPNGPDSGFYISPIWITEGSQIRGRWRGVWQCLHTDFSFFTDGQVISGVGPYGGKRLRVVKNIASNSVGSGLLLVETSDSLETN